MVKQLYSLTGVRGIRSPAREKNVFLNSKNGFKSYMKYLLSLHVKTSVESCSNGLFAMVVIIGSFACEGKNLMQSGQDWHNSLISLDIVGQKYLTRPNASVIMVP